MTVWIYGDKHMCGVASLIVRKLWGVTQIWLLFLVRIWKTFRTAFSVCLYRLFEVSYGWLNIWGLYHKCEVASLIAKKCEVWRGFDWRFQWGIERPFERRFPYFSVDFLRWAMTVWIHGDIHMCGVASIIVRKLWGVTQIWLMILVRLWKTFRTAFSVCLYRLFEVSYDCLNIWWYTHVWSCLTNCEKTVRCDADLLNDSCEALKDLSNGVFRMSLSTFWGELWLFEYMVIYTCSELPH